MVVDKTPFGIASGIAAGALWGLVFLAPELTQPFKPFDLAIGRYLAYGAMAAALAMPSWRRLLSALTWKEWRKLVWLSLTGNIVYYILLANAVQTGGIAMTSLVIGVLPVAVTLVGSRDKHAVPLRRLIPSICLSVTGLACISWQSLSTPGHTSLFGLFCALGALVSWTLYAVGNSRSLAKLQSISAHEWNLLTGIVTGALALVLAMPAGASTTVTHSSAEWLHFAGVVAGVAVICSVAGNGLWNYASRTLPLALMGQMIVFESVFALLYGFVWEKRWPTLLECAAITMMIAGVTLCATAHRQHGTKLTVSATTSL